MSSLFRGVYTQYRTVLLKWLKIQRQDLYTSQIDSFKHSVKPNAVAEKSVRFTQW